MLIPVWIIGAPFVRLFILSFSLKGSSAMGDSAPRISPRVTVDVIHQSAPLFDPMHPQAPRRIV